MLFLKAHLSWRSDEVEFGYVEHSLANRQELFDTVANYYEDNSSNLNLNPIQGTDTAYQGAINNNSTTRGIIIVIKLYNNANSSI